jgi:hypothetical protein
VAAWLSTAPVSGVTKPAAAAAKGEALDGAAVPVVPLVTSGRAPESAVEGAGVWVPSESDYICMSCV